MRNNATSDDMVTLDTLWIPHQYLRYNTQAIDPPISVDRGGWRLATTRPLTAVSSANTPRFNLHLPQLFCVNSCISVSHGGCQCGWCSCRPRRSSLSMRESVAGQNQASTRPFSTRHVLRAHSNIGVRRSHLRKRNSWPYFPNTKKTSISSSRSTMNIRL